jgi:hypothetical protein
MIIVAKHIRINFTNYPENLKNLDVTEQIIYILSRGSMKKKEVKLIRPLEERWSHGEL